MAKASKTSEKLLKLLNEAIARELQVSTQYMWQHVLWSGIKGYAVKDELKRVAVAEMKHAEAIAERLVYLGGFPTTKPTTIVIGENLKEMLAQDAKDEAAAIVFYKQIIETAGKEGDLVTRKMFEEILAQEEDHHDFFTSLLEDL